jgi:HEAT repeat protein
MQSYPVRCPHCGRLLRVSSTRLGKPVTCPICKKSSLVVGASSEGPSGNAPPVGRDTPHPSPQEGKEHEREACDLGEALEKCPTAPPIPPRRPRAWFALSASVALLAAGGLMAVFCIVHYWPQESSAEEHAMSPVIAMSAGNRPPAAGRGDDPVPSSVSKKLSVEDGNDLPEDDAFEWSAGAATKPAVQTSPPAAAKPASFASPSPPSASSPAPDRPVSAPALPKFKRRDHSTEDQLRKQLAWIPSVRSLSLGVMSSLASSFQESFRASGRIAGNFDMGPSLLLEGRPDLAYLPLRKGNACRLNAQSAATLDVLSRKLHALLDVAAPQDGKGRRPPATLIGEILREQRRGRRPEWLRPQAIPVLLQILMHEDAPVRRMLVELLADIPGDASSVALAQRALYDLSPEVRELALHALRSRPREEYRQVLTGGLRYPWAPVADHAAEALVFLDDQDDVPLLVALLKKPDPALPIAATGSRPYLRELVQIDHSANCMMCHAPSVSGADPARGPVPGLITVGGGGGGGRWSGGGGATVNSFFVRADIAYLRQDFSVSQPLTNPTIGLEGTSRFDYLVRLRPAKAQELVSRQGQSKKSSSYSQRESVLFALRELTRKDPGPTTEAWLALFPQAEIGARAAALTATLIRASAKRRDQLLAQYAVGQGEAYSEALARAIPALKEPARDKARQLLAQRLSQMKSESLETRLRDSNREIRCAAASACGRKRHVALTPRLIPLIADADAEVAATAYASLKTLTDRDFGPPAHADLEQRAEAEKAWQEWWNRRASN